MHVEVGLLLQGMNLTVLTTPSVALQLRLAYACGLDVPLQQVLLSSGQEVGSDTITLFLADSDVNLLTASTDACTTQQQGTRLLSLHSARALDSVQTGGVAAGLTIVVTPGPQPLVGGHDQAYADMYNIAAALTATANLYIADMMANGTSSSNPLTAGLLSMAAAVSSVTGVTPSDVFAGLQLALAVLLAEPPATPPGPSPNSGLTGPQIVGVVIGVISGVALIVMIALVAIRARQNKNAPKTTVPTTTEGTSAV